MAKPKAHSISIRVNACRPCPAPIQWLDGSTYIHHIELVRKSRGAEVPEDVKTNPLMYQGGSDSFLAPHEKHKIYHGEIRHRF
jgi:fumarylacetoacetate (FAA) hydrolase